MKAIKYQGRVWIPATKAHTIESPYVLDADAQAEQMKKLNNENTKLTRRITRIKSENKQQAEQIAELKILLQSASEDVVNGVYLIKKEEAENKHLRDVLRKADRITNTSLDFVDAYGNMFKEALADKQKGKSQ